TIGDSLTLRFLTPVLFETSGRLRVQFSFSDFFSFLSRRLRLLVREYGSGESSFDDKHLRQLAGNIEVYSRQMWVHESMRFSDSRGSKVDQTGLLGEITFSGASLKELLPLLVAGEFLHVGSDTAFGFGRYEIAP